MTRHTSALAMLTAGVLMVLPFTQALAADCSDVRSVTFTKGPGGPTVNGITITGQANGVPDPRGAFTVTLRDLNGQPLQGLPVYIYFKEDNSPAWAATCTDTALCVGQPDPFLFINDCYPFSVRVAKFTDTSGRATFNLVGQVSTDRTNGAVGACAAVRCGSSTMLAQLPVALLDQNGGGVNLLDVSLAYGDVNNNPHVGRSDYDFNGTVQLADVSTLYGAVTANQSIQGCNGGLVCD